MNIVHLGDHCSNKYKWNYTASRNSPDNFIKELPKEESMKFIEKALFNKGNNNGDS